MDMLVIKDNKGIEWYCIKAPLQDPYIYEDDEILCAQDRIWLKQERVNN